MKDIEGIEDIKIFVNAFYQKIQKDDLLGPIFESKINGRWDHHLEKMYDFWNTILFSKGSYKGSPYQKHEQLPVGKDHFDQWLKLFDEVLRERFEGKQTDETIQRAKIIGWTFWSKMEQYQLANGNQKNN